MITTTLTIAAIGMGGIFIFMLLFYLIIGGLDKMLPYDEEDEKAFLNK